MYLIYLDDSRDEKYCVFSALAIPDHAWQLTFRTIRDYRRSINTSDGIYIYKEFHAWEFVSGRGHIARGIITKYRRCEIFKETLALVGQLPAVRLFNTFGPANQEETAFERLLNRINRTMLAADSNAILICDEGKESAYTRKRRKMGVYNPIPSRVGVWQGGTATKNIPIENIIEDPFFKDSQQSYLIQMADFCAYALLRREAPVPSKSKYGIHEAFNQLDSILVKEASARDPEGIIRI
jgi:hypothetical protein